MAAEQQALPGVAPFANIDAALAAVAQPDAQEPASGAGAGAASPSPAPADQPDAPPPGEPAAPAPAPEAKSEPAAEPEKLGRLAKRLRDDRKAVAAERAELQQLKAELEALKSSANPWHEVSELSRRDPIAGLDRFAEMLGTSSATLMERYAGKVLGKEPKPVDPEVASVRSDIEALRADLRKRDEADQARQQEAQRSSSIEAGVSELMRIREPAFADKYPFASALDASDLEAECRAAINLLVERNLTLPADEIAEIINARIERLATPLLAKHQPGNGGKTGEAKSVPANPVSEALAGTPPVGGAIRSARRDITNSDAAGSVGERPMTDAERDAAAIKILEKAWTVGG